MAKTLFAVLMLGVFHMTSRAHAATDIKYSGWIEEVKMSGDIRLREEYFDKRSSGQNDRNRQRFRLRLNTDFKLPKGFQVKTTLASGTGEQVSTNQSFDNLSGQKDIWIDKVYTVWKPLDALSLQFGRMENPFWRPYSYDVVWDGDFNPEGFSQSINHLVGPFNLFATALQMVADEDSGNNDSANKKPKDQWMLGEQVGMEVKLPLESRFKASFANYNWINERYGTFSQNTNNEGNRRDSLQPSSGTLQNDFYVNVYTGVFSTWIMDKPVTLEGTYVVNDQARQSFNPKEDTGYQWGVIVGKAKDAKTWELAYFNKHVRTDATVADVSDSDFGDGGTNRKGHIVWGAFAPLDWMVITLKHFQTTVINPSLRPGADDIRRNQLDWLVKF